jgi:hypothetical protein
MGMIAPVMWADAREARKRASPAMSGEENGTKRRREHGRGGKKQKKNRRISKSWPSKERGFQIRRKGSKL